MPENKETDLQTLTKIVVCYGAIHAFSIYEKKWQRPKHNTSIKTHTKGRISKAYTQEMWLKRDT